MATIDPILDPDVQHRVLERQMQHFRDSLELLFKNFFPRGKMVGQIPETDKVRELSGLIVVHDRNVSVAVDANALPGDRERANDELLREEELSREILPRLEDAEPTTT